MIQVRIVTPDGVYKEFETSILNIESIAGARGILPNHVPVVTMLKEGILNVLEDGSKREYYAVNGGMLYYRENLAEIFTDTIKHSSEIDRQEVESFLANYHEETKDSTYKWMEAQRRTLENV